MEDVCWRDGAAHVWEQPARGGFGAAGDELVICGCGVGDAGGDEAGRRRSWFERLWLKAPSTALALFNGLAQLNGNTMWHAGNDGPGSTLDADTLDTYHASSFALLSGATFTGLVAGTVSASGISSSPLRLPTTGSLATSTNDDVMSFWHIADNEMAIGVGDSRHLANAAFAA